MWMAAAATSNILPLFSLRSVDCIQPCDGCHPALSRRPEVGHDDEDAGLAEGKGVQSVGEVAGVKQGGPVSGVRGTLTRGVQEGNGRNLGGGEDHAPVRREGRVWKGGLEGAVWDERGRERQQCYFVKR